MAEIPVTFAIEYGTFVQHAVQQGASRLRNCVGQVKTGVQGKAVYFETVGSIDMTKIVTRHGDTPYGADNYGRRRAWMDDYAIAVMVDRGDDLRTLIDPRNAQTQRIVKAIGRRIDDTVIYALENTADVMSDADVPTATALPTAQKIAHGSTGLTLAKILDAKDSLDGNEVDEDGRYFLVTSYQLNQELLATTEITNQDYNTVKALAQGQVDTFAGFKFIRSERLTTASSITYCYAFQANAMGLGFVWDADMKVDVLPTKNYSTQVYGSISLGAVRVEDKRVVQVACFEV